MDHSPKRLTPDDYDDIIRVWSDAGLPHKPNGRDSRDNITAEMDRDDVAFFGLRRDGRMVAVGLAAWEGRKGWISRVAVDPDCRGERLGPNIVASCEEFLRSCGATVISCLIEELNTPSMAMFRRLGYECWGNILYFSKRDSDES